MRPKRRGAVRQMRQREGCGMSCVKGILIGSKEKEDWHACTEKLGRKGKYILHLEAILVTLLYSGLQDLDLTDTDLIFLR